MQPAALGSFCKEAGHCSQRQAAFAGSLSPPGSLNARVPGPPGAAGRGAGGKEPWVQKSQHCLEERGKCKNKKMLLPGWLKCLVLAGRAVAPQPHSPALFSSGCRPPP